MSTTHDEKPPRQAVILAGGKGTRLYPLTETTPKPMIPFHGKPFLEYLVGLLKSQGISKILLLLGYLPENIIDHFGDGSRFGVEIAYHVGPVEDETGARLRKAIDEIDDIFLFLYCDNYLPFNYEKMWRVFCEQSVSALVTVYNNSDGYTKSNIRVDSRGRIEVYDKTRTAENLQGVDIGYMITKKRVLELIPEGNVSFEKTVYPQLVLERQLHAYTTHHRYYSVGDFRRMPMTTDFLARKPSVLIDRDGVLNKKMPRGEYVCSWADWQWLDGALEALKLFHDRGFKVILISNQAGIARGALASKDLESIHERMKEEGQLEGLRVKPSSSGAKFMSRLVGVPLLVVGLLMVGFMLASVVCSLAYLFVELTKNLHYDIFSVFAF